MTVPEQVVSAGADPISSLGSGLSQNNWITRLSAEAPQSVAFQVYTYVTVAPGPPDAAPVSVSVGGVKAAAGRARTVGIAIAQTNAKTATPAALRMAPTLDPPSVSFARRDRTGSACSHVHEIADKMTYSKCYACCDCGERQLAER